MNEMVGTCGTHRGDERCMQSFVGEIREKYTNWKGNSGMDIKRTVGRMWTGMFWFLKRKSDGLL